MHETLICSFAIAVSGHMDPVCQRRILCLGAILLDCYNIRDRPKTGNNRGISVTTKEKKENEGRSKER